MLSTYRSILNQLPHNSLLFTSGDNDTYASLYLQKVKNVRPDISVINLNLLSLRRYLYYLETQYKNTLFSTPSDIYLQQNFDYFLFSNKNKNYESVDIKTFLLDLQTNNNPFNFSEQMYKGMPLREYYADVLFFEKDDKTIGQPFKIDAYLFMNDYILFDILNKNRNRKIYFTYDHPILHSLLTQSDNIFEFNY